MLLTSARHEVDIDAVSFSRLGTERGWGDGLPLIPPTIERVEEHIAASHAEPDVLVGELPPLGGACTVELLAINAVMAGAPAASMPLLMAAVAAIAEPDFGLHGMSATTSPVVPAFIVNGPSRHELGIACGAGCVGGADGSNASIGRALRLVMRNVGGQRVGTNSKTVFGQPARVTGIVFGEWEEQSPWPSLGERRGVPGNAVTAVGANGTMNIFDTESEHADQLLDLIGRSLPFRGSNGFLPHAQHTTVLVGINPMWAEVIASDYPDVTAVQERLWDLAALPSATWPAEGQQALREAGMVGSDGRVHLVKDPERLIVAVAGGRGGLHALALHSNGSCVPFTKPFGARAEHGRAKSSAVERIDQETG